MKRRILMIAPSSIPTFGAEAIVNKKLITALMNSGKFEVDLVSQRIFFKHYPVEEQDIDLKSIHVIDNDLNVTPKLLWQHFMALFKFGVTFKGIHWALMALPVVEELVKNNKYDYVLTKDSPSFVLGKYLKNKYGLKWIATCNDPVPGAKYPAPYGRGWDAKVNIFDQMCLSSMEGSDVCIFPSDRLRNHITHYLTVNDTRIIPHVVLDKKVESKQMDDDTLRMLHSGTLESPRDPETFLRAFELFKKKHPKAKVEFAILGLLEDKAARLVDELKLNNCVKLLAPVSYTESLNVIQDYHIAVVIEAHCEEGIFLPTKVTDFMQCKKNIFAVSPKVGVQNDLFKSGHISYFADVTNVAEIAKEIEKIYNDFMNNKFQEGKQITEDSPFSEKSVVNQYFSL